jgi:hypothetical protein
MSTVARVDHKRKDISKYLEGDEPDESSQTTCITFDWYEVGRKKYNHKYQIPATCRGQTDEGNEWYFVD